MIQGTEEGIFSLIEKKKKLGALMSMQVLYVALNQGSSLMWSHDTYYLEDVFPLGEVFSSPLTFLLFRFPTHRLSPSPPPISAPYYILAFFRMMQWVKLHFKDHKFYRKFISKLKLISRRVNSI